jgi:hypothetical protein
MVFVDFKSVVQATNAMRKCQGHVFEGCTKGIAIDYDKDPKSKRNRNYENQRKVEIKADLSRFQTKYSCAICGTRCLTLGKGPDTSNTVLEKLPKRSTGDTVVDEAKFIADVRVSRGPAKIVKRPKGNEKQYRLNCTQCGICICYRPKPMEQENKYMYILPDALKPEGGQSPVAAVAAPATITGNETEVPVEGSSKPQPTSETTSSE